jgi:hypothetical protein
VGGDKGERASFGLFTRLSILQAGYGKRVNKIFEADALQDDQHSAKSDK